MMPVPGLIDHVTEVPEGKFCTENTWLADGAKVTVAGLTLGVGVAVRVKVAVPSTA